MNETPQQYTQRILGLVSGKEPLEVQRETADKLAKLIQPLSKKQLSQRPEPGKWSITEILAHLADSEIVLSWRMRLVICQNGAPFPNVDQDVWAQGLDYSGQDPQLSLETFRVLRQNNLRMLKTLPKNLWENFGTHSEHGKVSLRNKVYKSSFPRYSVAGARLYGNGDKGESSGDRAILASCAGHVE